MKTPWMAQYAFYENIMNRLECCSKLEILTSPKKIWITFNISKGLISSEKPLLKERKKRFFPSKYPSETFKILETKTIVSA